MRILLLSSWFPHPPDNGARLRVFNLLRQLARRHEIDLLSFVQSDPVEQDDLDAVRPFCRILGTEAQHGFQSRNPRAILRLFSPKPRSVMEMYNSRMAERVRQAIDRREYDLIIASEIGPGLSVASYVMDFDSPPRVIEDLELLMIWNKISKQTAFLSRMRHFLTWWKQKRYAVRLLRSIDGCTVPSEPEAALVRRLLPDFEPLAVVPNALDLGHYVGNWGAPETGTLIFPGALTYGANFEAMEFFLRDVWPTIRSEQPDTILRITGRTEGVTLDRLLLTEGVILTGYVDDIRPLIARSKVCIVPLLTGGGTRLKILESMALETPVVSTSRGAEGLEAQDRKHLLIADQPAALSEAILLLLGDSSLCAEIAANAKQLVRERYSWERCAHRLEDLLHRVVDDRQGAN